MKFSVGAVEIYSNLYTIDTNLKWYPNATRQHTRVILAAAPPEEGKLQEIASNPLYCYLPICI